MRELAPAARGSQDAGSRNLVFTFQLSDVHSSAYIRFITEYFVPQVFANLYHVMNDPAHWEEPRSFRPDRFIDQLTGEFIHNERVIPFGVGRRACPGKLLAEQVS